MFSRRTTRSRRPNAFRKSLRASAIWEYTKSNTATESFIASSSLNAVTSVDSAEAARRMVFTVHDYDLAATLTSGQAFRWQSRDGWWEGIIGARWVRLHSGTDSLVAEVA